MTGFLSCLVIAPSLSVTRPVLIVVVGSQFAEKPFSGALIAFELHRRVTYAKLLPQSVFDAPADILGLADRAIVYDHMAAHGIEIG